MRIFLVLCLLITTSTGWSAPTLRIINGSEVPPEQQPPWLAAITTANEKADEGQFCGGSLIHPEWVVTAAHCLDGESAASIELVFNRNNLADYEVGERIAITELIQHPDFERGSRTPSADLGLVRLAQPSTQPLATLADPFSVLDTPGTTATVMGWGTVTTPTRNYPDQLNAVDVPIVDNAVCDGPQSYAGKIRDTMICAGYVEGGRDACVGDSGGPLVVNTDQGSQQLGVVSFGEGCAEPNFYGVYTRLAYFERYISDIICAPTDIPAAPQVAVTVAGNLATARWEAVPQATAYRLYYTPYVPIEQLATVSAESISVLELGEALEATASLRSGDDILLAVRAFNGNCGSGYSDIQAVLVD